MVIRGSAFSPVSTQNRVTFGGVSAQVRSASATQLTVVVPSGARTGPVVITGHDHGRPVSRQAIVDGFVDTLHHGDPAKNWPGPDDMVGRFRFG